MTEAGSCECGSVAYSLTSDGPVHVYACHCLNCQTRSGSAFAEHAMVPASAFACEGTTTTYSRTANDIRFEEVFCDVCHTRLFNRNSALPDMIFLRAGTLAGSQKLEPIVHMWTRRKQHWISLPDGVPSFEESPTPEQFGAAVQQAQQRNSADR
ncbi:GFA family protein [Nitratireductor soli]|uniref:GFA family protein n=1 Tax=Nitratireductor soli TaxID=1670619 RepID=UPI00065DE315|nr:GFA family protein [Nitratireductor soli]